ncbi:IS66 family transposase [Rhizobium tumorigenes]|uniref:IS66 family transposase n=1 Tax=Rhizobium tumorigenes TaxID=2041385 RepID=A0AAF1KRJ6_9HYPH|nr:IS66 family transposase [Rhizobium tumorigenes]WFR97733.1 IS66 family transposase [Rhizobium tumorigenes]WFR98010.1 IS66 family transposase [Rhizobium tumorigenes]WFR98030.1 IS66 family transposase [Rhizobium tumorigenes]
MDDAASEIARLRAALAASEARAASAEANLAQVRAVVTTSEAMIRHLKLEIAKMRREQYGQSSERRARLIDQMELQLEELEADATEDEIAADRVAAKITNVSAFERRRPARKPFPEHLPRERMIIEAPSTCTCCGSTRIVKMGEDITETLEAIPRQWKVIQTVREKFTCRDCEKISQSPAPFHATPRGWAGPNLLATILFEKFGQHQPLNRQAERYAKEGVDLSLSTLADQVGACATALQPIHDLIRAHVLAAERLHGDDTTVPLLARGATRQARLWTYVRDDRPFAGGAPPAALFYFSPDREKTHPNRHLAGWHGILQADAYGGYNDLYRADRSPGPVRSALCWSHARRKFFELADIAGNVRKGKPAHEISPVALEAVARIDALFDIERGINGMSVEERLAARQEHARPRVEDLYDWLRAQHAQMSKHNPVAKAINYMFDKEGRWEAFTRFLDDGRLCLTNNAAERALRGIALGRKSWLFAGSQRGGERAAFMYSLIVTAKMNDIDPQAWLADVLARMPGIPVSRLPELLPWNWSSAGHVRQKAA